MKYIKRKNKRFPYHLWDESTVSVYQGRRTMATSLCRTFHGFWLEDEWASFDITDEAPENMVCLKCLKVQKRLDTEAAQTVGCQP